MAGGFALSAVILYPYVMKLISIVAFLAKTVTI